jgi:guanylate kinase
MEALKERLVQRKGDSAESIENRLNNAYSEIKWSQKYDYQITNDNLERAFQELKEIIQHECLEKWS